MCKTINIKNYIVFSIIALSVVGCGPTYILEYNDHQFYVEYPKDQIINIGDEFDVYKREKKKIKRFTKPAPPQYVNVKVGKIVIVGIADTSHGFVKLLQGELEEDFILKKNDETK